MAYYINVIIFIMLIVGINIYNFVLLVIGIIIILLFSINAHIKLRDKKTDEMIAIVYKNTNPSF